MSDRPPRPKLKRYRSRKWGTAGLWVTNDDRFLVSRWSWSKKSWDLMACIKSASREQDKALLFAHGVAFDQCSFPTRGEALDALALVLHLEGETRTPGSAERSPSEDDQ
jgi:hypothetical protein